MPDFSASKIYKITNNINSECYIGSTTQNLSWRFTQHKSKYKTGRKDCSKSTILFDKYGLDNCKIELIKEFPCNSKEELLFEERKHIQNDKNCMNLRIRPILTLEEKREYQRIHKKKGWHIHKDKYNSKKICETCNSEIMIRAWNTHIQTKKHQKNLN